MQQIFPRVASSWMKHIQSMFAVNISQLTSLMQKVSLLADAPSGCAPLTAAQMHHAARLHCLRTYCT